MGLTRVVIAAVAAGSLIGFGTDRVRAATPDAGAPLLALQAHFPSGYIEASLSPGQSFTATVSARNGGTAPATYLVSGVDGYTSSATGVVYGNRHTPFSDGPTGNGEYGAGRWISLSPPELHLAPGQSAPISLTITVPPTATPGDWVGGLTVENPQPAPAGGSGNQQLVVTEASEIAAVVHVPGNASKGVLLLGAASVAVDGPSQFLDVPLRYTGDVLVKPVYSFVLRDSHGVIAYQHQGQWDTFVPHTTLVYRIRLDPVLALGQYTFEGSAGPDRATMHAAGNTLRVGALPPVRVQDGGQPGSRSPSSLRVSPAWLVAPLALGLLIAVVMVRRARRCAHCSRRRVTGLMTVADFHEIAHCPACRRRALDREDLRLCPECYRQHVLPGGSLSPNPT